MGNQKNDSMGTDRTVRKRRAFEKEDEFNFR